MFAVRQKFNTIFRNKSKDDCIYIHYLIPQDGIRRLIWIQFVFYQLMVGDIRGIFPLKVLEYLEQHTGQQINPVLSLSENNN
jgi:hypothetical protein